MTSGELIKDARRRHGLSQRRLATRAGTAQAWISRIERGEVSPSVESLDRLLSVMGERLSLGREPIGADETDAVWDRTHGSRSMSERLERSFDAASFAAEMRGTAKSR